MAIADNLLPVWTIRPNWKGGILERLEWLTDVLRGTYGTEQARGLRLSPRRSFEMGFTPFDEQRTYFDLWMHRLASSEFMLPLFHDQARLTADVAVGATSIPFDTTYREFEAGGMAVILGDDSFVFDTVEIDAVAADSITVAAGIANAWPAGSSIFPLRRAQLSSDSKEKLSNLTLRVGRASIRFELNQANDIADEGTWSTLYGAYPLLTLEPNRREELSFDFQRMCDELDNNHGRRLVVDDAGRAFTIQSHLHMLRGRAEHWEFRQFIYRLRGRAAPIWVPTFNKDITLSQPVAAGSATLDIKQIGYGYTGQAVSGRRHILVADTPCEITGMASPPTAAEERLTLSAPLGVGLPAGTTGCFMDICRMSSDTVEITHLTDTDGVAEATVSYRAFRDERSEAMPVDYPIPAALMSPDSCSFPAESLCVLPIDPDENTGPAPDGSGPPAGVGAYDFALIEVEFEEMPDQQDSQFLAILRSPTTPDIDGMDESSWFPIQGMAYDGGWSDEYSTDPILAFPPANGGDETAGDSRSNFLSLRVDLRTLPTLTPIEIDLYGYLGTWYMAGGPGVDDDGNEALDCVGSEFYGHLTRRYGDANPKSPSTETSAEQYLTIKSSLTGFGYERLIATFPEYAAMPYAYEGGGFARTFSVSFQWVTLAPGGSSLPVEERHWGLIRPTVDGVLQDGNPDDPNAWLIYPVINAGAADQVTTYWGDHAGEAGFEKTRYRPGGGVSTLIGPSPTINNVTSFSSPPPAGKSTAGISGIGDSITLFVPTWKFGPAKTATVKAKAVKGANPWTATVLHPNSEGADETVTWDNALTLNAIGSITVDADDGWFADETLPNKLGYPLLGTITIDRNSGSITFTPA